ncbi:MAG TPA: MnhB domain-containing protein [Kiritimatiellia bacterium]|nr:MnhB domain-containing protein [Kiritimatiellia bacterium]
MSATRAYIARWQRALLALGLLPLLATLLRAVWTMPAEPPNLAAAVAARMDESGVTHPLTAVLLNFRGYDTMLEIVVLWIAGLGAIALAPGPSAVQRPAHPILVGLLRILAPALAMTAGYILWAGGFRPGGAFQAGSIIGAGLVLASLAGLIHLRIDPGLRLGLGLGLIVFLAGACWAWALTGELLHFPGATDKLAILLIESAATLSIGLILLVLFDRLTAGSEAETETEAEADLRGESTP